MKKTLILAAAVAALTMLASSCQKEEFVGEPAGTGNGLVFTATIDNAATKTTVNTDADSGDKGKVSWEETDEITIGANNIVYVATPDPSDASKATFVKKDASPAHPSATSPGVCFHQKWATAKSNTRSSRAFLTKPAV